MSTRRQTRKSSARRASTGRRRTNVRYQYGTAVKSYSYENQKREYEQKLRLQRKRLAAQRKRAARINAFTLLVMIAAMCVLSVALISYADLRFEVTHSVDEIAACERELTELKEHNEQTLRRIEESVSLDDIKYTAITQLHMKYPEADQIYTYNSEPDDYVKQKKEVTGEKEDILHILH